MGCSACLLLNNGEYTLGSDTFKITKSRILSQTLQFTHRCMDSETHSLLRLQDSAAVASSHLDLVPKVIRVPH